jgi:hypothetical protein
MIMSAATHGLSQALVALCGKYPRVALVVVPFAGWMAYDGLSDASFVQRTAGKQRLTMSVERVYNEVDRPIFPKFRAAGRTTNGPAVVGLSKKEFDTVKAGDGLEIIETGDVGRPFVTRRYADVQRGYVRFSLAGIPFNDAAIFGCMGCLVAIAWAMFGRQIADRLSRSQASATQETARVNNG